jgi:hypothetical protein
VQNDEAYKKSKPVSHLCTPRPFFNSVTAASNCFIFKFGSPRPSRELAARDELKSYVFISKNVNMFLVYIYIYILYI